MPGMKRSSSDMDLRLGLLLGDSQQVNAAVAQARGHIAAPGGEREPEGKQVGHLQLPQLPSGGKIPEADRSLRARGHERSAVGGELHIVDSGARKGKSFDRL